jgi:general secretion pathway protein D
VTGKTGPDDYITLTINPQVSSLGTPLSVPGGGSLPSVNTRSANTIIRVKNGETIAIGGLIQDEDVKTSTSVPGLSAIPFFGKLFQDTRDNKTRDEVVFFLTTKVIK